VGLVSAAFAWSNPSTRGGSETALARPPSRRQRPSARGSTDVPTLFRFFATLAILAGLVFAAMFALANFVQPTPREMTVSIPASKLQPGNR
jgi:hypothetical protein